MIKRHVSLSLLYALALTSQVHAQQVGSPPAEKQATPWSGKAALGYLATSGNTESSSLNSGFALAYTAGRWAHSLEASAIKASEDDATSAEAYSVGWKTEFNMTERDFLFGRVNWRKDRFSAYEQQLSESVGYGRRLIDTGVHFLNVELGAGAEELGGAQGALFVLQPQLLAQLLQAVAAVLGQAHHPRLADCVAGVGAVAQHLPHPAVLGGIGGGADRQRGVAREQPADRLGRDPRRRPRRGVAGRDLAGVGEAGFHRRFGLAVDHDHVVAGLAQVPGGGDADDSGTKDQDTHGHILACKRAKAGRPASIFLIWQ